MISTGPSNSTLTRLAYRGESMRGTFRDGDCLWMEKASFDSLRIGDVVAFGVGDKVVAHRIVGRQGAGFVTRGDGVLRRDGQGLIPERFFGRVMERERSGILLAVSGGARGRRRAAALHAVCLLRVVFTFAWAAPYRLLRASRWMPRLWRPQIMTVHFVCAEGEFTKFIHRGKTVACWIPHERRWTCRKPFDLILDPPNG